MRVVNGKWVDKYDDPVDNFNSSQLIEIGKKVKVMYGENITSTRIDIISSIVTLTEKEESSLANLLNRDDVSFSKLAGF
jgi:hypothetical protein